MYGELGTNQTELSFGSELIVTSTKTVKLCSNDGVYEGLNIIELKNAVFNEAFDAFSEDLVIADPNANSEEECRQAREFLGFEPDYIDDYEICREFEDIKCDYDQGGGDNPFFGNAKAARGGKIPDFVGFEFKEQSFEGFEYEGNEFTGFEFEGSEFVGFEFTGFEPSEDLTFQEVQAIALEVPVRGKDFALCMQIIICRPNRFLVSDKSFLNVLLFDLHNCSGGDI